ncbi:MAG: caspase family protein [Pseudomonadota bacterium]
MRLASRFIGAVLTGALLTLPGSAFAAIEKRVALVIGNGAYQNAQPLPNPTNDARAMEAKLRGLGFEVVSGFDQEYDTMRRTIASFARVARGADVALVFYAGHGLQVQGQNFLVPVDAQFKDETALDFETISMDFVIRQMSYDTKVRLVLLDACRDNPLARTLARGMNPTRSASVGVGLAEIKMEDAGGEGSVIAFATSPGDVAMDGTGPNSPFTEALLRHIDAPNTTIQSVMTRVTGDVYRSTKQRQRPWVNASLIGEVFLNRVDESAQEQTNTPVASLDPTHRQVFAHPLQTTKAADAEANTLAWDREKTLFDVAKTSGNVEDYETYLAVFPNGFFAEVARNYIRRQTGNAPTASLTARTDARAPVPSKIILPTQHGQGASEIVTSLAQARQSGPASETTESLLGWNRADRREVQVRVGLAGHDLGRPDGVFGRRTRAAVSDWQAANGLPVTGFFNPAQNAFLKSTTNAGYASYLATQTRAASRNTTRSTSRNATRSEQRAGNRNRKKRRSNGRGTAGAAFMGGLIGGAIGGAIGARR